MSDIDNLIDGLAPQQVATQSNPVKIVRHQQHPLDSIIDEAAAPELLQQQYGTGLEQAKAAAEAALSAGTFGLSSGLERGLFNNAEEQRARAEANPGTRMVGQVAGLALPALLTGGASAGAAGAMEAAGEGGAAALGLGGAEAGLASRLGAHAVKGAIEGAIFQGGDEVSKMLLSDPHQSVGTAASNIGLASLLGGGISGLTGAGGELWKAKFGKATQSALEAGNHAIESGVPLEPSITPEQALTGQEGPMSAFKEAAMTNKPNIQDLESAARDEGVELTAGMRSGDPFTQRSESVLSKSATSFGRKTANEVEAIENKLAENAQKTLRDKTEMSAAKSSEQLRQDLVDRYQQRIDDLSSRYNAEKSHFDNMEVSENLKNRIKEELAAHPSLKTSEDARAEVSKFFKNLDNVENVTDVKALRTNLNKKIQKLFSGGAGGGEEGQVLLEAKNALTKMREEAISQSVQKSGIGRGGGAIAEDTVNRIRQLDSEWSGLKGEMRTLADNAKLGRASGENLSSLNKKLLGINDNSIVDRFFPEGNLQRMMQMKEQFPKEFELARRIRLKEVFDNSIDKSKGANGKFSLGKFLGQLSDDKIGPEAREMLFNGRGQTIENLKKLYRAIPKDYNPSGTYGAMTFGELFTPKGILNEATDAVKYMLLKASPHFEEAMRHSGGGAAAEKAALHAAASGAPANATAFKQTVGYIANTIKGETKIAKGASAIFDAAKGVIPSTIVDIREREKLDKKLKDLEANATPLMNDETQVGHYMPDHGIAIAQTTSNAVNYLNALRPSKDKMSPLDGEPKVSKTAQSKFDRALDIAQNPLTLFKDIKQGTVTQDDLKHLNNLYPGLYSRMNEKINHQMIEAVNGGLHIPYKTKIGLSMFMGQPLDSTMSPQGIMSAQPHPAERQQQQMQQPHKMGMKSLNNFASAYQTPGQARAVNHLRH